MLLQLAVCIPTAVHIALQVRLVRELEKKFSGRPVVFVAQRRILSKPKRNQRTRQKQLRPRRFVIECILCHYFIVYVLVVL